MARQTNRLTGIQVERLRQEHGMHADGGGLYLQVGRGTAASWVLRYQLNGTPRWMGLGPLSLYGLKEARAKALDARRQVHGGVDPVEARRDARAKLKLEAAKSITFNDAAAQYIDSYRKGWRNAKHAAQWTATLATYAYPVIGLLPVQAIDTAMVIKILEPIWATKPETAGRVRGRIEAVLDWARVRGYRQGENPARWRGHLDKLLPARSKVRKVKHHPALPHDQLPRFVAALRQQEGAAARALEFAILTAARTGEAIGARWREFDLSQRVWIVPAERMKNGEEHRVPLSGPAMKILSAMKPEHPAPDVFVFGGGKAGKPLSNMAMLMLLRRMGMKPGAATVHGFRSTQRDWAAERTNFPREVVERALSHKGSDKVEAAYFRSDLFERRRRLMAEWAQFCEGGASPVTGDVVQMRATA